MDLSKHTDKISMRLILGFEFILCFQGSRVESNYDVILPLQIVLILANNEEPDEMPSYAIFHLGLYCFPKYLFIGINLRGSRKFCQWGSNFYSFF